MIQFICDSCGRVKKPDDAWLLGLAAESVGITSATREVNMLSTWSELQAVHPLAVHFCSTKCSERYLKKLFGKLTTA
jgi:hypothetical protein